MEFTNIGLIEIKSAEGAFCPTKLGWGVGGRAGVTAM